MRAVAAYYAMRGGFDPWSAAYPTPLHSLYAGDPSQGSADGAAIASWRNVGSIANAPWGQATEARKPAFRQSVAALLGRSTLQYDGGDHLQFDNNPNKVQPIKVVAVVQATGGQGTDRCFFGRNVIGGNVLGYNAANEFTMAMDTPLSGGAADLNPHVIRAHYNGVSSELWVDGVQVAAGDVGTAALTICVSGSATINNNLLWIGHKAYLGVYDGAVSDASLRSLEQAAGRHYGITVAA